jgi:hypothetical protein
VHLVAVVVPGVCEGGSGQVMYTIVAVVVAGVCEGGSGRVLCTYLL